MKQCILLFIAFAAICSFGAICYVILEILFDRREKAVEKEKKPCGHRREHCVADACLFGTVLVGIGAISFLGQLCIAHRVNKIYGNLEERRRGK